ncbi:WWE protein-protein interaction domain protein family [Striga asiatica]|uniref:WWE protein-protein interaction domain protein family n=1 Tax=Striga asiatica TaxID=4170 RepID=A0A5A7P4I4_STRAF|nr:WWE protein-protein interaction domain protein family [Striga asiatica]
MGLAANRSVAAGMDAPSAIMVQGAGRAGDSGLGSSVAIAGVQTKQWQGGASPDTSIEKVLEPTTLSIIRPAVTVQTHRDHSPLRPLFHLIDESGENVLDHAPLTRRSRRPFGMHDVADAALEEEEHEVPRPNPRIVPLKKKSTRKETTHSSDQRTFPRRTPSPSQKEHEPQPSPSTNPGHTISSTKGLSIEEQGTASSPHHSQLLLSSRSFDF